MSNHQNIARIYRHSRIAALILSSLLLTGCGLFGGDDKPAGPTEILVSDTAPLDLNEEQLYRRGRRLYENGLFKISKEAYDQLAMQYPFGPYIEAAHLGVADCLFSSSLYDEAAPRYTAFAQEFPTSTSAEYAKFQAARSYLLAFKGPGHDITPLEESRKILHPFLKEYPSSVYFMTALAYLNKSTKLIAEHEGEILDFYIRTDQPRAVAYRRNELERRYTDLRIVDRPNTLPWYNFWSDSESIKSPIDVLINDTTPIIIRAHLRPELLDPVTPSIEAATDTVTLPE